MSKRAEKAAEAYENSLDYYHYTGDNPSVAYKAGYEHGEKDTIELTIKWLKVHFHGNVEKIINEYKKAFNYSQVSPERDMVQPD